MTDRRRIERVWDSQATEEGGGVNLKRAFGHSEAQRLDPFLMLDDFHSTNPDDYVAGFPFHPHRGMETVTYMISGSVEHQDSIGNKGVIESGDVQWMTAGSGILHQEMPRSHKGMMQGFQLWVNLPRAHKMMAPRYRDVKSNMIPIFRPREGVEIKVIAGGIDGTPGPVRDLVVEVEFLDVRLGPGLEFRHEVPAKRSAFAYVFEGDGHFEEKSDRKAHEEQVVLFTEGQEIWAQAGKQGARFLFASGVPLNEPIAWRGPVVMNTQSELDQAFDELRRGTFVKIAK
jgi:redox-sensitive bicupin YhaK (pirin superfamily)